ncbi:MAG: tRNA lysidine(34) synthetase TilS [Prevotellaceae bacterium]|nr:tRNA lysidine(34) synthetase TilS [Prevotellaceae bacterium]
MKLLACVSGGADSVAMLLYLLEEGHDVTAAHCNFHLRGAESDRDEAFVRRLCADCGVALFVRDFDTAQYAREHGVSIEMAARTLRYKWFETLRRACEVERICVAHHAGDRAETLLLNLVRGTGIRGLGAMRERNGYIWRPLLNWTRTDIETFLSCRGRTFVDDSTNVDVRFRRNKVRREVLPLLSEINPDAVRTLAAAARHIAAQTELYDYAVSLLRTEVCEDLPCGGLRISLEQLKKAPSPDTLLHEWLAPYGFGAADVPERIGGVRESGDYLLTRTATAVEIGPKPAVQPAATLVPGCIERLTDGRTLEMSREAFAGMQSVPRSANTALLDASALCGQLAVRSVKTGDAFTPFGMSGRKLVSDYLTDRHISRIGKLRTLAVCDERGIVWLVGHTIAERCRVGQSTHEVVRLVLHKKECDNRLM